MKKQTAIEWLEQLYDSRPNYEQFILSEEFKIAKEIEKEQIIEAHGAKQYHKTVGGEEYYKQTYNKNI